MRRVNTVTSSGRESGAACMAANVGPRRLAHRVIRPSASVWPGTERYIDRGSQPRRHDGAGERRRLDASDRRDRHFQRGEQSGDRNDRQCSIAGVLRTTGVRWCGPHGESLGPKALAPCSTCDAATKDRPARGGGPTWSATRAERQAPARATAGGIGRVRPQRIPATRHPPVHRRLARAGDSGDLLIRRTRCWPETARQVAHALAAS
jgi:hypothetical protein